MMREAREGTDLEDHLQQALKHAENSETKYQLRTALQKLHIEQP